MRGVIEKIWENQDRRGKPYLVLEIAGRRYSLWDEEVIGKLDEGLTVEYEWKQAGKYRNLTKIETRNPDGNYRRTEARARDMVRMSCLKSAAALLSNYDLEPEKKGEFALELAKRFEQYVSENDE